VSELQGAYRPADIEPRWQRHWVENKTFKALNPGDPGFDPSQPKYYILDMFPYTSGSGLHVGHPEGYTATDIVARYRRMCGFNVLHPIGWDSFGLPAEQHAVQTGVHPRTTTEQAIAKFKEQLQRFGFSYDWDRELATTDLKYYKWTQWIFLQMFNSWFDPQATGEDENGHKFTGRARPIAELIAQLESGERLVDKAAMPQAADASPDARIWNDLSGPEQQAALNTQRLAFMDEVPVNWCPMLGTVLANEEVTNDGRSERGNYPVYRRPLNQWMLRITRYCERLIADIDHVDWPDPIKMMQRNWVGRSVGAEVNFHLVDPPSGVDAPLRIFTTRPDTLFGATYMVLAPEHPLVERLVDQGGDTASSVKTYVEVAARRSELDRTADTKEKTGVFTGAYAINPVNDERIPIWVADYVLMGYGTGAIMAVPAHDDRDHAFATTFDLPIREVITPPPNAGDARPFTGEGTATHSGEFDGQASAEFKTAITCWLQERGLGCRAVNYKLRDWLFSRQRYWGEPFPILHGPDGAMTALSESQLPLDLPHMEDFKPHSTEDPNAPPQPPLSKATEWATVEQEGETWHRELNTMPQWAGSCWYYLRYLDPTNDQAPWDPATERYWMNVDQYVGGAEHAVLHLLYARFWHKVLFDLGHVSTVEPFQRLYNQGLILSHAFRDNRGIIIGVDQVETRDDGHSYSLETGQRADVVLAKMSKALKNVVNPDEILDEFGADTFRLYEMYMGPLDAAKPWNTDDIPGLQRFLNRAWRLMIDEDTGAVSSRVTSNPAPDDHLRAVHKLIKKVGEDVDAFKFNTAIAAMIAFTNEMTSAPERSREVMEMFVKVLAPFAPHIAEELWARFGHSDSIAYEAWPQFDAALVKDNEVEVPVQLNGKIKAKLRVPAEAGRDALEAMALADSRIIEAIGGKTIRKVIVVPGKLVNLVVQ
jgi:leucyl-tRNA synthetase